VRGTLAQFVCPVVVVSVAAALGMAVDNPGSGLIAGTMLGGALAVVLALHARRRLRPLRNPAVWEESVGAQVESGDYDDVGLAVRSVARFMQVAARQRSDDERQRQQQATVLNRMNDGLMRVGSDGRITWANVAAGTLYGGRNPIGRSFVGTTRDHELHQAVRRCLDTGVEQRHTVEIAGEGRLVSVVAVRLDIEPPEVLVMLRDITEVSRLQSLRRDFVANVSHELRTPLSTIKILTETLLDLRENDPEAVGYLQKIDHEVDAMTALVRDLLDLTRLETSAVRMALRDVDAQMLIRDVADRLRPLARRNGVEVQVIAGEPIPISVDEKRLQQALVNLATNAIDHTPPGGIVELRAEHERDFVALVVRDTGSGIPPDDLPHVWERLFKGDRARSGPGTGLGLAIVKHIAQAHDGDVAATSTLGKGSEFRVVIPLRAPTARAIGAIDDASGTPRR
jgi:two-component system phosphate regulon sensor histidine kinase PhoR